MRTKFKVVREDYIYVLSNWPLLVPNGKQDLNVLIYIYFISTLRLILMCYLLITLPAIFVWWAQRDKLFYHPPHLSWTFFGKRIQTQMFFPKCTTTQICWIKNLFKYGNIIFWMIYWIKRYCSFLPISLPCFSNINLPIFLDNSWFRVF